MKIVVSYISSLYDYKKTIELIDKSKADAIHADLMDGKYVKNKNFDVASLGDYFTNISKPIEFHLMVIDPLKYINEIYKLNPKAIYIHPKTTDDALGLLKDIRNHLVEPGIVINPNEEISLYKEYFPYIRRVLLMSVTPGEGGQEFLISTTKRLDDLMKYKREYGFNIYIDGGINDLTISRVLKADGVVSGSFVCKSPDYDCQIDKLKNNCHN